MEQYLRDTLEGLDRTTEEALLRPEEQSALNNTTREPAVLRALETYMLLDHLRPRLSCEQISEIRGAVEKLRDCIDPELMEIERVFRTNTALTRLTKLLRAHLEQCIQGGGSRRFQRRTVGYPPAESRSSGQLI